MAEYLVEAKNLCKYFKVDRKRMLKAVDDVSLGIRKGETLGLVGESGCGKTTCGRTLLHLYEATSGQILFDGKDVSKLHGKDNLEFKHRAQMIFQDPYSSLDPRMTIGEIIAEGMDVHVKLTGQERQQRIVELLAAVGLTEQFAGRFAHELSGGQRQRVGIARALAVDPDFIVCDDPISALDVSIQAQILNLLEDLKEKMGLTYIFITHDLSVVNHFSDEIAVMYLGQIVEKAPAEELFQNPLHPYTKALLSAIPQHKLNKKKERILLKGEISSPIEPPDRCRFQKRCYLDCAEGCYEKNCPGLREVSPGHFVACHHV